MNLDQRVKVLEDEVKVLKNEIKAVLLDIREHYLNYQNPFSGEFRLDERRIKTVPLGEEKPAPMVRNLVEEEKLASEINRLEDREERSNVIASEAKQPQSEESPLTAPTLKLNKQVESQYNGKQNGKQNGTGLATLAGLTQWVDQTTQRIGKQRAEALVEGLHMMEHLPLGIRDFLLKFIQLSEAKEPQRRITTKDYLTILTQLEGLLGQGSTSEMALVSILTDGKGDSSG